ncbi:thiamine-phosphate synthase [Roseibium aquae]|uniref:Thiamine-phosphate synthase n=1 Tax=Roseibium aquae TaxID=1323746 RepID=A0A916TMX1_9HYPH|nr:thiamine phosphate synthase [Roseibium aquae]GGB60723.1 thiamine-phosphate synthase [Roseibium aquae]
MTLDPFYLIVGRATWIDRLAPLGLKLVQLRVKDMEGEALLHEIITAKAAADRFGVTLVINDHWQAAIEAGCQWVHLGQEDLLEADRAAIRAAGLKLGLSSHDGPELEAALAADPDYIALGPIFPTTAKQLKWEAQGLEKLRTWKKKIGEMPLVAIGGLTPERAVAALEHGADSAAVITDVVGAEDPDARTRQWLDATKRWR